MGQGEKSYHIKSNYSATSNPGVSNDINQGYAIGSHWVNTSTDKSFICVDNTAGAAVWNAVDVDNVGISNVVEDTTPELGGELDTNSHNIKVVGQVYAPFFTLPTSGAITIDWNKSNKQKSVLSASGISFANPSNLKDGASYTLMLVQDRTGGRTVTWGSNFLWDKGITPVLSTVGDSIDIIHFVSDGVKLYGVFHKGFR